MKDKVASLLKPIADEKNVDVLSLNVSGAGYSQQLLKVIVDRKGGVDIADLEAISRGLSLQLDVEDLFSGAYKVEVSTPGLSWPLTTAEDFCRYEGDWLKIDTHDGRSVRARNMGMVDQDRILVEFEDGREGQFSLSEMQKVVRFVNWSDVNRRSKRK